jgi:outer membrane protein assembly factor BamB
MNARITVRQVLVSLCFAAVLAGCAGRNLHKNLVPNTKVMTRGWTLPTHGAFDANDRGFEYSNSTVFENTLIFGNASTGVTAIYPEILRIRWNFPVQNGVISELLVEKKAVFFGGGDGFLYSLNADTGKLNWKYEIKQGLVSRPTFSNGRLFVTTADDSIFALDAGTGKWLWTYKRRTPQTATIHAVSTPLVDGNEVIAGLSDGFIVAVSLEEGTLKWERKIQLTSKFTDVDAAPILVGESIYIPSYDGALYALRRKGGDTLWRFDAGGARRATVEDQTVFLPSSNGTVYALSTLNAKVLWQFELDRGIPTQVIITDRYAIFGSSHQYLYALDKATGAPVYRFNVGDGSGFSASPTYDKPTSSLYLLSMAGNLYQFKLRKPGAKDPDLYQFDSAYASKLRF